MSFDIYVAIFRVGEPVEYDTAIAEEVFAGMITRRDEFGWALETPDGAISGFVYIEDAPKTSGFSVSRPPRHRAFWGAILEYLQRTGGVVFWPGTGMGVPYDWVIPELPRDMIESLGDPTVVTEPLEILELIQKS